MTTSKPTNPANDLNTSNSDDNFGLDDILTSSDESLNDGAPTNLTTSYSNLPLVAGGAFGATTLEAAIKPSPTYTTDKIIGTGGHLSFDINFLTSEIPKDSKQVADVLAAAQLLSNDIMEKTQGVTINVGVDFSGTDGSAGGGPSLSEYDYSTVKAALLANAATGDTNFADLPTTFSNDPSQQIWVASAEAKALGLSSPTSTGDDGSVTFSTGIDDSLLEGVALHEITHAMGRVPEGPPDESDDTPDIFDLFRFTEPGSIYVDDAVPTPKAAYFSVDGGTTLLADYGENSDPSDFANSDIGTPTSPLNPNDPFNQYYSSTTVQGLTQLDLTQLDVLGFNTIGDTPAPCYVRGTRIRTERGDVAVEDLRVGDLAVTAAGALRPIVWIGHRHLDLARHPDPAALRPVRVLAGALGEGLPSRDLWLSPGHNIAFEGALLAASRLINGCSVVQVECEAVEYWHVELETHDLLVAEGLAAESYLDCGNRTGFSNGGDFVESHPDFRPKHWAQTCLPLVFEGPALAAARRRLIERLPDVGFRAEDADAHVRADGLRVEPIRLTRWRLAFVLPEGAREIALCSRVFVPAEADPEGTDLRVLGVAVSALQIDGDPVDLSADAGPGWSHPEHDDGRLVRRWTTGEAMLPSGARLVVVDLTDQRDYWRPVNESAPLRKAKAA